MFGGKRGDKNVLRTQTKFILEKLIRKVGYVCIVFPSLETYDNRYIWLFLRTFSAFFRREMVCLTLFFGWGLHVLRTDVLLNAENEILLKTKQPWNSQWYTIHRTECTMHDS